MAEQRLISAEKLKYEIEYTRPYLEEANGSVQSCIDTFTQTVDEQPTIDPETLPIVNELRAENKKLTEALGDSFAIDLMNKLDKVEKERDAAIEELQGECFACKNHFSFPGNGKCKNCRWDTNIIWLTSEKYQDNWEWRGAKEEQPCTKK